MRYEGTLKALDLLRQTTNAVTSLADGADASGIMEVAGVLNHLRAAFDELSKRIPAASFPSWLSFGVSDEGSKAARDGEERWAMSKVREIRGGGKQPLKDADVERRMHEGRIFNLFHKSAGAKNRRGQSGLERAGRNGRNGKKRAA